MSKTTSTQSFLALSCVGAIAFATAGHAQEAEQSRKLGSVTVTDTAVDEASVKVDKPASPKYTAPLVDTPQTITVVSRANIEQQNLLTLREVLANVPGITYTAGEGGNGYADNININGVDARNDITVNGVRSSSNLNRNETYNIEQVEVTTGANSVYSGGGNVAGSINLVTKQPRADDKIQVSAGVGTDNYWRGTVDINKRLTDMIAVRLNAVYHQNDVPGRDYEFSDRWGVAPSVKIGLDGPTSLVLQYEHLTDHALPFYGIPYYPSRGGLLPGISRSTYFGVYGADKQNSKTDAFQAIASHEFSEKLRIRLLNRYENILQETNTTNPGGNYCLADGSGGTYNPANGGACAAGLTANTFQSTSATRSAARRIHNETLSNQLDLTGKLDTGGVEHSFNIGASYLWESFDQTAFGNIAAQPVGGWPIFSTTGPSPLYTGPLNYVRGSTSVGKQEVFAGYLFDTVKFTNWLQLNGGIRWEKVKGRNYTQPLSGDRTGYTSLSNELFSYRVGLVFKPTENTSLYVAYGNSRRPSQSAVSTGCTQAATTPGVTANNNCTTKPETTKNYEIGAKAEFFEKALLLTGSFFRNDRDTIRLASGDPTVTDQVLDGKQRTEGFNIGITGNVTPNWSISGSFQHITAKIRQGVSDFCLRNPGFIPPATPSNPTPTATCTNSAAAPDPTAGSKLTLAPENSGSIFTNYKFPFGLEVGYGLNYQGRYLLNTTTAASPTPYYVASYITQRLMVAYTINEKLRAQVNVQNLFNEKYLTTVRTSTGSSWGQPGAERSAVFSLTGSF